jgi:hypothetical protein
MSPRPSLSVVVVVVHVFSQIRRAVRHLREQDLAGEIELVLVAPSEAVLGDRLAEEVDRFAAIRIVTVGPVLNVDRAAARGVQAATADVVAVIEDHAFVGPGWARALIEAHARSPWVAVGSAIENANPRSGLSWANLLLGYGWWIDRDRAGEMRDVPSHNGSYRREALAAFGDTLPDRMERFGGLHDRLRAGGGRMYLAGDARLAHANPSLLLPTARLRFHAGRLHATERAAGADWSIVKRLLYAVAFPLIPLVRLWRLFEDHLAAGRPHHHLFPRVIPALLVALFADAAGQAAGYLRGAGAARGVLAVFEMDRLHHLTAADRRLLSEPPPAAEVTRT